MRVVGAASLVLAFALGAQAQPPISGALDLTLGLLPAFELQGCSLTLKAAVAGLGVESESTFYHDGLRYQSFSLSGPAGPFDLEGKIYFHAQEVRYRRAWAHLEMAIGDGTLLLSAYHFGSAGEYTSSDEDRFGPWPCVNAIPWDEAWQHIGRTLYVEGPVVGYDGSGPLKLYLGRLPPDPERLEVSISAANVAKFEEVLGPQFWQGLVGKVVCVRGTIKDVRYTTSHAHSAPQVTVSSTSDLTVGSCCGLRPDTTCPHPLILWSEVLERVGETVSIQGPVASVTSPAGYRRLRLGGGETVPNRLEVYIPEAALPAFQDAFGSSFPSSLLNKTICVRGMIGTGPPAAENVARVVLTDPGDLSIGPCCGADLHTGGLFVARTHFAWDRWSFTVDLSDCGVGLGLLQATAALEGYPLADGLRLDLGLTFSKCRGLDAVTLTLEGLSVGCCDLAAEVGISLTPGKKTVTFTRIWPRLSGCLTVYGDVDWNGSSFTGISIYGWRVSCSVGPVNLGLVTALDPDAVEDMTDVTFYADEFEYVEISSTGGGCCGGSITSTTELWFGAKGTVGGLQRVRLTLEIPLAANATLSAKGQWNFVKAEPLEWFNVGGKVSF